MNKYKVILSSGSIPWLHLQQAIDYSIETGYDGLEIVPTKCVIKDIAKAIKLFGEDKWGNYFTNIKHIKGIHQNWRLDIGYDKKYKIKLYWSLFFTIIRVLLFPEVKYSNNIIGVLSKKLKLPVTVHDITSKWTHDIEEFSGGIFLEMIGEDIRNPLEIKNWLEKTNHKVVLDTRDDQSLLWAIKYGFESWQPFWEWIGLSKIGGLQLTLIGIEGLRNILNHKSSVAEEQLLWLNKQKWKGPVTVEVNPLSLCLVNKGRMQQGLRMIASFIRQTLGEGKVWTN